MLTFPPSPAPSQCDSLADIDDLDAFLNAQGRLSHFPTPPKREIEVTVEEIEGDEEHEYPDLDYDNIANCMIEQTPSDHGESESDVVLVRRILLRARLPPEILAIAFNILSSSRQHPSIQSMSSSQMPLDLHVIGALALATAYAEDHPYSFKYWSCYISDKRWRGRRINEVAMNMLAALDWRLHHLATPEAVAETMHLFQSRPAVEVLLEPHTVLGYFDLENTAALKLAVNTALCVNGLGTVWQCGLVTPETTPTSIGVADRDGAFLRLL